ncbi:hypothetical protein PtB15_2B118 [Puccinia triticina]|nr:hypothetical protein PtB15_2B118 [Puccinia triticina]
MESRACQAYNGYARLIWDTSSLVSSRQPATAASFDPKPHLHLPSTSLTKMKSLEYSFGPNIDARDPNESTLRYRPKLSLICLFINQLGFPQVVLSRPASSFHSSYSPPTQLKTLAFIMDQLDCSPDWHGTS